MKKLICMLLSLTMLFSIFTSFSVFALEDEEETVNSYISQLVSLGILEGDENGEIHGDSIMTRAQFCTVISRITGVYGTIKNLENDLFTDVDNTYWAKDYIVYCAKLGLVSGYGDNTFLPEAPVETYQAIKILVELLGYGYKGKVYGGYPTGYIQVAREIGLLKGVDVTEEATLNELSRLIYNALKVDLSLKAGISGDQVIYEVYKGKNLLTEYLSMNVYEGVLDGCYAVSILGNTELLKNEITIDKVKYICNLNYDLKEFIGKRVSVFYKYDSETMNAPEVMSIVCDDKNEIITLDVCDITSAANNVITYLDENDKDIDIKFSSSIKYIVNYKYELSYDIKKLPNIKNGKVELIDNNGDNSYDILNVVKYETFVVENASENSISGKLNGHSIDLTNEDKIVSVKNRDGEAISLSKIKENTVLFVVETAKVIDITVSTDVISGTISSMGNGELEVLGTLYEISEEYTVPSNAIGGVADLYLDPNGRVAFIIEALSSDMKLGYFININLPEDEYKDGFIKLLIENGSIVWYKLAEKINLGGTNAKLHIENDKIENYLKDDTKQNLRNQVIRYQLNDNEEVFKLEVSAESFGTDKDGFVKVIGDYTTGEALRYDKGNFNGRVFPSNKATVFVVPSKDKLATATEDDYTVIKIDSLPESNSSGHKIDAYHLSKEHHNADVIVFYNGMETISNLDLLYDNQICIFMSKTSSVNSDNDKISLITYFDGKDIKKLPLKNGVTVFDNLIQGDVIRISLDLEGKEIVSGEVRYKAPRYDSDGKRLPSSVESLGNYYGAAVTISGGYVASIRNNMFRVASSEKELEETKGSKLLTLTAYPTTANNIIVVEHENKKCYPKMGSSSDLAVGDYVIVQQRTGSARTIIIFKGL